MKNAILSVVIIVTHLAKAQEWQQHIPAHDPVLIRQDSTFYLFCTGKGIAMWSSNDMINWKAEKQVFDTAPRWATDTIPGFKNHIWAPDISYFKGRYFLFYAVSAFGKNTSAIGLATNATLHTGDPAYHWVDHGRIIQSYPGKTNWNAIDPNLVTDLDGTPYLAFGSFWEGLELVQLNSERTALRTTPGRIIHIATREKVPDNLRAGNGIPVNAGTNAIEAPFIFYRARYFYLFASIDYCCKGTLSTYKMIVGRSKKLKGPYIDRNGLAMITGGGSILLQGDKRWYGVGHNAVCTFDGNDYLVFHGYDSLNNAGATLRIEKLQWIGGWPEVQLADSMAPVGPVRKNPR